MQSIHLTFSARVPKRWRAPAPRIAHAASPLCAFFVCGYTVGSDQFDCCRYRELQSDLGRRISRTLATVVGGSLDRYASSGDRSGARDCASVRGHGPAGRDECQRLIAAYASAKRSSAQNPRKRVTDGGGNLSQRKSPMFLTGSAQVSCELRRVACLARLPQTAMLHHRRARPRVRSTNSSLQPKPSHARMLLKSSLQTSSAMACAIGSNSVSSERQTRLLVHSKPEPAMRSFKLSRASIFPILASRSKIRLSG